MKDDQYKEGFGSIVSDSLYSAAELTRQLTRLIEILPFRASSIPGVVYKRESNGKKTNCKYGELDILLERAEKKVELYGKDTKI